MTVLHLFGTPGAASPSSNAVGMIRRARVALAKYLPPDSGVTRAEVIQQVRDILNTPGRHFSGNQRAEAVIWSARTATLTPMSEQELLNTLLHIFDGPAAQEFATSELPYLVGFV